MKNHVLDGITGLCVADALGVPLEFMSRETLRKNPVIGMRGFGTHNQPAGTWFDGTSMALCLLDSVATQLI
ncbi:MAG: ADP-ribosylglycohydrolase family protein [Peptococcaceae bacterium]|nr:ADP-ribosylglycohydrolase family protein [Peptococcaceae bacterium]